MPMMSLYLLQSWVNSNQLKFLTTGKLTVKNKALPCNNSCKSPNLWPNEIHCPVQKVVSVWWMTDDRYWCAVCRVSGWPPRRINHVWVSELVSWHPYPPSRETDCPLQSAWQVLWSEVKVSACGWWRCGRGGHDPAMVPWHQCHRTATYQPVPATGRCCCRPHKPVLSRCTLGQQPAGRSAAPARAAAGPATSRLLPSTSDRAGPVRQPGRSFSSDRDSWCATVTPAWLEAGEVPREDGAVGAGRPRPHTGRTPRHLQPPAPGLGAEED